MIRKLIYDFQKLVCRINGHKFKVIRKDLLLECRRCGACAIRKGFLNGSFEAPLEKSTFKKNSQQRCKEEDKYPGSSG
jgi:hypothetical protein